jgi:hypothetical protein
VTYALQMLRTHPADLPLDEAQLAATIDALTACSQACTACADACLSEAAVQATKSCADSCGEHAEAHEHCRLCAQACREAEQALTALLGQLQPSGDAPASPGEAAPQVS